MFANNVSKDDPCEVQEHALVRVETYPVGSTRVENLPEVRNVVFHFPVDSPIVQVNSEELFKVWSENQFHNTLKCHGCVFGPERHSLELVWSLFRGKGCFAFVLFRHGHLVIS